MSSLGSRIWSAYRGAVSLPDRLYPFKSEIEGKMVRGRKSYERAVEAAYKKFGNGRLGYKLMAYRQIFHFAGAILFITSATLVSHRFFGSDIALYVLLGAAIAALSIQEFYIHPRSYHQRTKKGVADWAVWVVPMMLYLVFFVG